MWYGGRGTSFHVTGPGWCCRGAVEPTSPSQPGFSHRELATTGKITGAGVNFVSYFHQISGCYRNWLVGGTLSLFEARGSQDTEVNLTAAKLWLRGLKSFPSKASLTSSGAGAQTQPSPN